MISRFTLDSATEFLFGKDVRSLSVGLVYPPNSPLAADVAFQIHPANMFARAFLQAQILTSYRSRLGWSWRLFEFWSDHVKKHMEVCYKFIDPILNEALRKKRSLKEAISESNPNDREVLEGETLLDHLVNCTEGGCFGIRPVYIRLIRSADLSMIRDEILNIMIAGRDTVSVHLLGKLRSTYSNSCTCSVTDCRHLDICHLDVVSASRCALQTS